VQQDGGGNIQLLSPQEQVNKASEMAKVLQGIVNQADLARSFGGKKKHLEYEAWQTIGQFFNCSPVTEWTRPIKDNDQIIGWEARVNIVNNEGRVIASAENMCMRDEPNWKTKPNYALRSMAQTRAGGKAFRSVFAFVAVLAGYSATPLEEMDSNFNDAPPPPASQSKPKSRIMSEPQHKKAYAICREAGLDEVDTRQFLKDCKVHKEANPSSDDAKKFFDRFDDWLNAWREKKQKTPEPQPMFDDDFDPSDDDQYKSKMESLLRKLGDTKFYKILGRDDIFKVKQWDRVHVIEEMENAKE